MPILMDADLSGKTEIFKNNSIGEYQSGKYMFQKVKIKLEYYVCEN